jgi:hypothetical protein
MGGAVRQGDRVRGFRIGERHISLSVDAVQRRQLRLCLALLGCTPIKARAGAAWEKCP